MGYYSWERADSSGYVTAGITGLTYAGVIQANDGHGGFNTRFNITGSVGQYHVHFRTNNYLVTTIRYKPDSVSQGYNVLRFIDNTTTTAPRNLTSLVGDCGRTTFPNHRALLRWLEYALYGRNR